jgi:peroxiredoxin
MNQHYDALPDELPRPVDDGAADHLPGTVLPSVVLARTDGGEQDLGALGPGRTVLYVYPRSGVPGVALPPGWDDIPGARGCTPESAGFRDHFADLRAAGADAVFGISSQDTDYQRELAQRLGLPFPLLSDPVHRLEALLGLPTFDADSLHLYRRITLIVSDGRIEHAFYPIFPPDTHAAQVLAWLQQRTGAAAR